MHILVDVNRTVKIVALGLWVLSLTSEYIKSGFKAKLQETQVQSHMDLARQQP